MTTRVPGAGCRGPGNGRNGGRPTSSCPAPGTLHPAPVRPAPGTLHPAPDISRLQGGWDAARREKIARAREKGRRRRTYLLAGITIALIVAMVAAGVYFYPAAPRPLAPVQGNLANDYNETMVSVPLSSVNQTARYYKWDTSGKTIRFFAVLGTDGQVRTAFDNAYCCYRKDLGERQEGPDMVCNLCNKHFPIDELNRGNLNETMAKQCCPADLPHIMDGGNVLIRKSDIEAGAYLFKA